MAQIISKELCCDGYLITVKVPFDDFEVVSMPKNCYTCQVGYYRDDCGRRANGNLYTRPTTCKLKEVDILPQCTDEVLRTYRSKYMYKEDKDWFFELYRLSKLCGSCDTKDIADYISKNYP